MPRRSVPVFPTETEIIQPPSYRGRLIKAFFCLSGCCRRADAHQDNGNKVDKGNADIDDKYCHYHVGYFTAHPYQLVESADKKIGVLRL